MENIRVRGIVFYDGGIILIKRIREENDKTLEYYAVPGGGVEANETIDEALKREMLEELGITVNVLGKFYEDTFKDQMHKYYICELVDGIIGSGTGPEYTEEYTSKRGQFIPTIIPLKELENINLQPVGLKNKVISDFVNFDF